jgi:glycosyltransferase involved in cell wall biosynthesis
LIESDVPELSVIVLCYRAEEGAVQLADQLAEELANAEIDYELVLVANYHEGMTDATPELVSNFAKRHLRAVAITGVKEGMMGWDMRSGLRAARGAHIAVIDGDGQMPMSDIVKVYRLLQFGNYDLVKTFRAQRFDGAYRAGISYCYNLLFRILFPSSAKFRDINSKPKVMTREAYEAMDLASNDWFTDAEIMPAALRNRMSVGEVSTIFLSNERRASFVPPSAILEFLRNLISYRVASWRRSE